MSLKSGFSLVELTVVLGIVAILFSISALSFSNSAPKNTVVNAADLLMADFKQQQLYALTGAKIGQNSASNHGIYFANGKYTLFHGNSYNPADSGNLDVKYNDINFSSTAAGSVVIFIKNSGQIQNFQPSGNSIILTQVNTGDTKTIIFNKYGIIE
jgi:prepilin-type N-terminal cleavage/methylation domain-containing protein